MSITTSGTVKERIKYATQDSPIAVFKTRRNGYYRAVFGSTAMTAREINQDDGLFLGEFYGEKGSISFSVAIRWLPRQD